MIFSENDDIRGCTVRLRCMEPGESLVIPMDARRTLSDRYLYDEDGHTVAFTRYSWGEGGLHRNVFQDRSGGDLYGCDVVEVLHRPEPGTQKPSNKEPPVETMTSNINLPAHTADGVTGYTVKTTTAYEAGVMHLVAHTADGVTGYTVEATALGGLSSMDIDELRQLRDVIDAALSDAEGKA